MENEKKLSDDQSFGTYIREQRIVNREGIISGYQDNKNVIIDKNFDYDVSNTRKPVYMVRGKSLTKAQLMEILSNEEPLFDGWSDGDSEIRGKRGQTSGLLGNCFYRNGADGPSAFLFSDGTLGGNFLESLYPSPEEILPKWIEFGLKYDFLDMAVGYTDQNEGMCQLCSDIITDEENAAPQAFCDMKAHKKCDKLKDFIDKYRDVDDVQSKDSYEHLFFHNFDTRLSHVGLVNRVKLTISISGGKIRVMFGSKAVDEFKKYYNKYNDDDLVAMYDGRVFKDSGWHIFGQNFIKECFRYKKLPEKCYDIAVDKGLISPVPVDAKIVTADFIKNEHEKMIEKLGLKGAFPL
ncbi:MAG: hypothetical protein J1E62_07835 [Lachnospiraceae bacterium]|nr:hypothetical protein [Lachnospiraceae bacterium]